MTAQRSVRIRTVALLGGGVVAGAIAASAFAASAQTTATPSTVAASATASSSTADTNDSKDTNSHGNETAVTGTKAASLKAAALQKSPGATIGKITTEDSTDSSGAAYEVHVTTASGTKQSLLFKSDLTYVSTQTGGGHGDHGRDGGAGEKAVSSANAATLKAAALKQVPGATVNEVTSDSGDAAFEVHLTKADGTKVTAKFDKNLRFVAVEAGRGK